MKDIQKSKDAAKKRRGNKFLSLFLKPNLMKQTDHSKAASAYKKQTSATPNPFANLLKSKTQKSTLSGVINGKGGHIFMVSKAHNLTDFSRLIKKIVDLRKKRALHNAKIELLSQSIHRSGYSEKKIHIKSVHYINHEIKECKKYLAYLREYLNTRMYSTNIAFISFTYKGDRDDFISQFGSNFWNRYIFPGKNKFVYKNRKIEVYEAPEPNDILWQNLGVNIFTRLFRRILTYVSSLFIVFLSFLIVISLKSYQISTTQKESQELLDDANALEIGTSGNHFLVSALISMSIVALS
jgi:hypothetical protein